MIPRYSRKEMSAIWEENNKFNIWLKIEKLVCEAQEKLRIIPSGVAGKLSGAIEFDIVRINEIESAVKHDVIAFLTYIAEKVGVDVRYLHYGMTSSDVLDTCLAVQLRESCDILLENLKNLLAALRKKAENYKDIVCVGRSHGMHAEPTTLGLKFARFYAEFKRGYQRLINAQGEISTCKMSGAVGNFANVDPFVEEYVAEKMGLISETVSSQVIPRDRHAMFFSVLGVIASSMENVAVEIRHLQRTEIGEISEYFSVGQKGSSAMPHKCNPILSENLTGLSRLMRSYVFPALENVALWHERDISHSSVERCIAPDACIAMDFALVRLTDLIDKLVINKENVERNLNSSKGLIFSQRVLLELVNSGLTREEAYKIVQSNAMKVKQDSSDFLSKLKQDKSLLGVIDSEKLESLFDLKYYTKHVDHIYNKVFN
ncbi:adenylosuccinate lyase [Wolbachia endosymbiont of Atemnus politus]|uniref:adenylosuccinate lyase n=1 Tax=Wolbachia endosymbiont of Atemnus politus TaxID=2682840 RepID=UPI001571B83B|nr:adenylosuccinate lyase [Wolbachia endosymbiont of Atemnus politus]NSM56263.1 adenylosuccinate lyase [Wolbachia endosymbiont of Atemnus politus]NSX83289.1 adenylosuccinate lyase [Wolbachia endosymbiont of Atemnus politus]